MRQILKDFYDAHQWVRVLTWVGLASIALLLYWLEGGIPPPILIVTLQTVGNISHLWTIHGISTLFLVVMLAVLSLALLLAWGLLLWVGLAIVRHHRGLHERQARREAWQTTRRLSDLDAFSFPGAHTLARTMMDAEYEDDNEANEGSKPVELRPPIRLPQHTQLAQYVQPAQQMQQAQASVSPLAQPARSLNNAVGQSMYLDSPLVAVKDLADIPTTPTAPAIPRTPAAPRTQSSFAPRVLRSIEAARAEKRPLALQQVLQKSMHPTNSRRETPLGVVHAAVEDIPTTPHPPSAKPSSVQPGQPSQHRTARLDTSAHIQTVPPEKPRTSLTLEIGVGWHTGLTRQRSPNEDSLVTLRGMCTYREQLVPFGLFVVADGMGGHACGQEASRIAIRTLAQSALHEIMQPETLDDKQLMELLARAVEKANSAVYQRGQEWDKDMGTTLTAALIVDTRTSVMAYVVNAGDSRTYLLGKGESLQQITRDHSLVANLVAAGAITPEAVYTHPERNKVYRSLGNNASIDIDWFTRELRSGDTLLLCSDGLWEMVRDPEIERILRQPTEPTLLCNQLIQAALKGGGADNVSAVVVRIA